MAHALHYVESVAPESAQPRRRRHARARWPGIAELKRRALVARLQRKAALADDPATWTTLTGLSDEKAIAILRRR